MLRPRYVGAFALLLLLAGCGSEKEPLAPTTPRATAAPSEVASTPTPPAMPEEAKQDTKAGAVKFVRWYVELINYAQATGDVDELANAESDDCGSCAKARQVIARVYDAGGHIAGGSLKFTVLFSGPRPDIDGWIVSGGASAGAQTITVPGSPLEHHKGGKAPLNFLVSSHGGRMRIVDWSRGA